MHMLVRRILFASALLGVTCAEESLQDTVDNLKSQIGAVDPSLNEALNDLVQGNLKSDDGMPKKYGGMTGRDARKMMKELKATLSNSKSTAKIAETAKNVPKGDNDYAMMVGPTCQEIAATVLEKYGFKDELKKAMDTASEAAETEEGDFDKKLMGLIAAVNGIITGRRSQNEIGRTPELDALADMFLGQAPEQQRLVLQKAEEIFKGLEDPDLGTDEYIDVMKGTLENGEGYLFDRLAQHIIAQQDMGDDQARWNELMERMNVGRTFMRLGDAKKLRLRMQEMHMNDPDLRDEL